MATTIPGVKNKENFIMVRGNPAQGVSYAQIPCYPDSLQESQSANWSSSAIIGRSSQLYSYVSTDNRHVDLSFKVHRELAADLGLDVNSSLEQLERTCRKSVYPSYSGSVGVASPITTIKIGDFRARGFVSSVSFTWEKPIIDGKYQVATINLSIVDLDEGNNKVRSIGQVMPHEGYSMNPNEYTFTWGKW